MSRRRWRGAWPLCAPARIGATERDAPDGRVIELRRNRLPDGGFVTLYSDITARKRTGNALRQRQRAGGRGEPRRLAFRRDRIARDPHTTQRAAEQPPLLADGGMAVTQRRCWRPRARRATPCRP